MIYILYILFFTVLFLHEKGYIGFELRKRTFYFGSFFFIALFAFRGENVGGDTYEYCRYFMGKLSSTYGILGDNENIEIGFQWFCMLMNRICKTPFFFIFTSSILSLLPFILLVKRYSSMPNLTYFYILCSNFMNYVVNIETHIRQNISGAFIMMALLLFLQNGIKWNNKKNFVAILSFCVVAVYSHTTSYVLLPLLIIIILVPFKKIYSISMIVVAVIISLVFVDTITNLFVGLNFMLNPYEELGNITRYIESDTYGTSNKVLRLTHSLPIAFWTIYNVYKADDEENNNIFIKCMVIGTVVSIACGSFGMVFRMVFLYQLLGCVYIPKKIAQDKRALFVNLIPYVYLFYRIIVMVASSSNYDTDTHLLPYNFIWE